MKIVVTGATGNVGTRLVEALGADERVSEIVGLARRLPSWAPPKTRWVAADVLTADLEGYFAGAAAVVHLAWLIQPARDERTTHAVNVDGSRRVFAAAGRAGAGALVHASSVGAYSVGPKDRATDESWPTEGISSSFYSRHKAEAERALDEIELAHPRLRVVRLRPGVVGQREAGSEIRRLFAGPFLPSPLVRPGLVPVVPDVPGLRVQVVHAADCAQAYRLAALTDSARGAYNVATEPVLDPDALSRALGARKVPVPARLLRAAASLSYLARLQPTPPGWLDLGLGVPIMSTERIRSELGWRPAHSATDVLLELMQGVRESAGRPTPPLDPATSGRLRLRELATGIGRRNP